MAFTGKGEQHVSFDNLEKAATNGGSDVTLDLVVANEQGKIYADTPIPHLQLNHDTVIKGNYVELYSMATHDYDLHIEGTYLAQKHRGLLLSSNSTLSIDGDLRVQSREEDGSFGESATSVSIWGNERVVVKGDVYFHCSETLGLSSNGVLELHGNIYHFNNSYFQPQGGSTGQIIFAGDGEQHISAPTATKGRMELRNIIQNESCKGIVLDTEVPFISLGSDVTFLGNSKVNSLNVNGYVAKFEDSVNVSGSVFLQEGAMLVDRDLTLAETAYLGVQKGVLNVKGNLHLKDSGRLNMSNDEDLTLIGGSIYNDSTAYQSISRGLLDVKGNYRQTTTSTFRSEANAIVQFSNPAHQSIAFPENAYVWFYNLGLDGGLKYTFTKEPIWTNLFLSYDAQGLVKDLAAKYFGQAGTNAATGNYSQSISDLKAPSVIGPLDMTHTYNSLDEEEGILGKGFTFSQNMKLKTEKRLEQTYVTITLPNGARNQFVQEKNGTYTAKDSRNVLTKEGSLYLLTTVDQTKITFHEQGHIQSLEDKIGNVLTYKTNTDGNLISITDASGTTISLAYDGKRLVEVKNTQTGEVATFGYANGKLITSTDMAQKTTRYEYGDHGLLTRLVRQDGTIFAEMTYVSGGKHNQKVHTVKNVAGNVETYGYDEYFRKTTLTDSNNRKMVQEFDASYSITRTTNPLGEVSTTTYVLTNGQNKHAEVASETDVYGNTTTYGRDIKGRILRTTYPDGSTELTTYDNHDNAIRTVDTNGMTTFMVYDETGKWLLKEAAGIAGQTTYNGTDDNKYAVTTYVYDTNHVVKGLVVKETHPLGDEKNYQTCTYNQKGLATTKTTYVNGKAYPTTLTYNDKQQPIKEVDADGVTTEYTYNQHGEAIRTLVSDGKQTSVDRVQYDALGQKTLEVSPIQYDSGKDNLGANAYSGGGTAYTYDVAGNVLTETDILGNTTTKTYDVYGNVTKEVWANGSYTTHTYDALDRVLSSTFFDHTIGAERPMETRVYAQTGRNLQTTVTTQLDAARVATTSTVTDYVGREVSAVNAENSTTRKTYTKGGDVATETDALGQTTRYTYDVQGNVLSKTTPFEGSALAKTVYTYDQAGNQLSEVVDNQKVSTVATTRKTTYAYDPWGRLHTTIWYDGETPASYVQTYMDLKGNVLREYKGLSKPLTITGLDQVTQTGDANYTVTKKAYNYLNQVTQTTNGAGQVTTTTYDAGGNPLVTKDPAGGVTSTTYDLLGRTIGETKTMPGKEAATETIAYDAVGNQTSITTNGVAKTFTYDGANNVKTEQEGALVKTHTYDYGNALLATQIKEGNAVLKETSQTYDLMGRMVTVKEGAVVKATYTYDKGSRLLTTTHANGLTETNTYNLAGLPLKVVNRDAKKQVISEYTYTYAVDGNQLSKEDKGGTTTYQYDGLNRLTEEVHTTAEHKTTISYGYDENNNRLSKKTNSDGTVILREYQYDKLDQLVSEKDQKETIAYTYDVLGNMVTKTKGGTKETKTYDIHNQLVTWTNGKKTVSYTYYADHKRKSKTVEGVTTEHIWVGEEIQLDRKEGQVVQYTHGKQLVASDYGTYLYNANGDVVQLVHKDQVVARYDYDAYGNARDKVQEEIQDETDFNPFRYGGEYRDPETKYIYLRARYYDPDLGRFINQDPIKDGHNWHVYGNGNPVRYQDPTGEYAIPFIIAIVAAAFVSALFVSYWNIPVVKKTREKSTEVIGRGITKGAKALAKGVAYGAKALGVGLATLATWNVGGMSEGLGPANTVKIQEQAAEWRAEKAKEKAAERQASEGASEDKDKSKGKSVPQKARDVADQVGENKGNPPDGHKGGKEYRNEPKDGGEKLPEGTKYKEYDVNKHEPGKNRGKERIVIGEDGTRWYTNDHYDTFTPF